jgi:release factor glutamine methyltransferase
MDIRTALKQGLARLRAANISSHTLAAELLLLHATGRTRTSLYSHPEDQLTESESQNYLSLIERRAAGVPTQHLTGEQEFWGLELEVRPTSSFRSRDRAPHRVALDASSQSSRRNLKSCPAKACHRRHRHRLRPHRHALTRELPEANLYASISPR